MAQLRPAGRRVDRRLFRRRGPTPLVVTRWSRPEGSTAARRGPGWSSPWSRSETNASNLSNRQRKPRPGQGTGGNRRWCRPRSREHRERPCRTRDAAGCSSPRPLGLGPRARDARCCLPAGAESAGRRHLRPRRSARSGAGQSRATGSGAGARLCPGRQPRPRSSLLPSAAAPMHRTIPSLISSRQIAGHPATRAISCASVVLPEPGGPLTTIRVGRGVAVRTNGPWLPSTARIRRSWRGRRRPR